MRDKRDDKLLITIPSFIYAPIVLMLVLTVFKVADVAIGIR